VFTLSTPEDFLDSRAGPLPAKAISYNRMAAGQKNLMISTRARAHKAMSIEISDWRAHDSCVGRCNHIKAGQIARGELEPDRGPLTEAERVAAQIIAVGKKRRGEIP
jgi:hypothetical protein